jgi:prepilin-type N-terminal cleavage/methylation domain-containing protein
VLHVSISRTAVTRHSARRGMTLLELLISLILVGLMGSLIVGFLLKQERFYAGANEILQTRTQVRQASAMLPNDLRAISPTDSDIYAMTDTSIEFRSTFGSSYLCKSDLANSKIVIPPVTLAKNNALTTWSATPTFNDSLELYVDGTGIGTQDDKWSKHRISGIALTVSDVSPGCQSSTGLIKNTDPSGTNPSYGFTITPTQASTVSAGAAVRFFKRVHYSLYKASDGLWYLGYYDCRTSRTPVCNAIQPIAGPLRPYIAGQPEQAGLRFTFYDATGAATTNRFAVGRVSILLQGEGTRTIQLAGGSPVTFRDSLRIEVGIRNWQ